jgi:heme/copper-type cytochrome/quinol oxidase subunit 3
VVLGLVAVALQCIEYTVQHFGPTNGAYASVFCAWTGFYLIAMLFTMYWLETQVATEDRVPVVTPAGRRRRRLRIQTC